MQADREITIHIPEGAARIIGLLEENGYEAYVVGGCVRDALLGRKANDWDITTSAAPEQVKALFHRTVDTGIAHGTVTVLMRGESYEVTTYRIDGKYEDSRHPKEVIFTPSLEEDLKRRDFTINAMAYSRRAGLVDLFDGTGDLARGIVRCVGDPGERFSEDALRILRALRFAAQLDFTLDPATARAAGELAPTLRRISAERIRDELMKLLASDRPGMLDTARELGITAVVLPEFDGLFALPLAEGNVGMHTLRALEMVQAQVLSYEVELGAAGTLRLLRLTMLLHDMGKLVIKPEQRSVAERPTGNASVASEGNVVEWKYPAHAEKGAELARAILRRLKFDNETVRVVTGLIRFHTRIPEAEGSQVRHLMHEMGADLFPLWLQVKRADILAQSTEKQAQRLPRLAAVERVYRKILADGDAIVIRDLKITGADLIADGMKSGRELGAVLAALLEEVLEEPEKNERAYLLERSRALR